MAFSLSDRWMRTAMIAWGIACVSAFAILNRYAQTPSPSEPDFAWTLPAELRDPDKPTLVLFAHPRCPCTRASLRELERLQAETAGRCSTRILFYEPESASPEWRQTDLWRTARALPETRALADPDAKLARAAGAHVSGTVGLFDAQGEPLFWGGLTPSRGHEGDSVGGIAIRRLLEGRPTGEQRSPVYGCEIIEASACGGCAES